MIRIMLTLFIAGFLVLGLTLPAFADDGTDYGYWCTTCGRQHGAGESCPNAGGGSSTTKDEPYDWSQPVTTPAPAKHELTDAEKFHNDALQSNEEGEALYRNGEYDKAYMKFWRARFNDPDTPLYQENLNKAQYRLEEQDKERRNSVQDVNRKLPANFFYDTPVVNLSGKKKSLAPSLPSMYRYLTDEEMQEILFEPGNKVAFEKNPYGPLINPLREPERYKAWEEAANKRHREEINRDKAQKVMEAMDNDKSFISARDRIIKQQGAAIIRDGNRLFDKAAREFAALKKKNKLKDYAEFLEKEKTDAALKNKSAAIVYDYWEKRNASENKAWHTAFDKVGIEVKGFFRRHPKLKN